MTTVMLRYTTMKRGMRRNKPPSRNSQLVPVISKNPKIGVRKPTCVTYHGISRSMSHIYARRVSSFLFGQVA